MKLIILSLLSYLSLASLFQPKSFTVQLTDENFNTLINYHTTWLLLFYADWCHYSQQFAPQWEKLAIKMLSENSTCLVGAIECSQNTQLKAHFDIHEYPYVLFYENGKVTKYTAEKDIRQISNWVFKNKNLTQISTFSYKSPWHWEYWLCALIVIVGLLLCYAGRRNNKRQVVLDSQINEEKSAIRLD